MSGQYNALAQRTRPQRPQSLMTSTRTCPTAAQYGASASKPPVSLSDHAMRSVSSVGL